MFVLCVERQWAQAERGMKEQASNVYYSPWSCEASSSSLSSSSLPASRPKLCWGHLHRGLKRGADRAWQVTLRRDNSELTLTQRAVTQPLNTHPLEQTPRRRTSTWAEAQLTPQTPWCEFGSQLNLTERKMLCQVLREWAELGPTAIKTGAHLNHLTGKLNFCSSCCFEAIF